MNKDGFSWQSSSGERFIVVEGDTPIKMFIDQEDAESYKNALLEKNIEDTMDEYDYEDELAAVYQNGSDGGDVDIVKIDLDDLSEDDGEYTASTEHGDIIFDVNEIYDLMDEA